MSITTIEYMLIAGALRDGAEADIWYDAAERNDDEGIKEITSAQTAMVRAAEILEQLAADETWGKS